MTDTMDGPLEPAEPTGDDIVDLLDLIDSTPVEHLLDRWLEESLTEIGDEPDGQEQVDRLLWVLRRLRQRRQDVIDTGRERAQLITNWASREVATLDNRAAHLERVLEGWAQSDHEDTGRKTWNLPAGVLKIRPRRERIALTGRETDQSLVAAVGALLPGAIVTTQKVAASEVKAATEPDTGYVSNLAASQGVEIPDGYEARHAIVDGSPDGYVVVPGVFYLVPKAGREGRTFSAVTE